jgi:hypothetical protein
MPMKTISDVPQEKLKQLVEDLGYDGVPKQSIRVSPQPDGNWRLDYVIPEAPNQNANTNFDQSSAANPGFF